MPEEPEILEATQIARIAVYDDLLSAPRIIDIQPTEINTYIENIATTTYENASRQGGSIPYTVIREVSENFIHANFKEVTVSILDHGCTIRFADQGPGIENKDRAQLPGFTSATEDMKGYIRGVGSGLPIVKEYLKFTNGRLVIEDNIKDGTVITIAVDRNAGREPVIYQEAPVVEVPTLTANYNNRATSNISAASTPAFASSPASKSTGNTLVLEEKELNILALGTEIMSFGPTDVTNALGIPNATAFRLLQKLQKAGLLMDDVNHKGKRVLTQLGLKTLEEQV